MVGVTHKKAIDPLIPDDPNYEVSKDEWEEGHEPGDVEDTLKGAVSGDIIIGDATPKWARLPKGTNKQLLQLVLGLPAWVSDLDILGNLILPDNKQVQWSDVKIYRDGDGYLVVDPAGSLLRVPGVTKLEDALMIMKNTGGAELGILIRDLSRSRWFQIVQRGDDLVFRKCEQGAIPQCADMFEWDYQNQRFMIGYHWFPYSDNLIDIGGSSLRFKDLYISGVIKKGFPGSFEDVEITSPADKEVLAYEVSTSKWKNKDTVADLKGTIADAQYPADLSGKTRTIKVKDEEGNYWYVGGAKETYTPPSEPDPLNNLTWSGITFESGYLSDDTGTQHFSYWSAGDNVSLISLVSSSFTGTSTDSTRFKKADLGELRLKINGSQVDSFDLASAFVEGEREGDQTYPPQDSPGGKITVLSVGMYNSYPPWQKGQARINLAPADLQSGENKVEFIHYVDAGEQYTVTKYVFKDAGSTPPTMGTPTHAQQAITSSKYLSGIRFYSTGDQFKVSFSVTGAFDNTFSGNVVYLSDQGLAIGNEWVGYDSSDENYNLTTNIPNIGDPFSWTDKVRTIDQGNVINANARLRMRAYDPHGNSSYQYSSSTPKYIVHTYGQGSTDLIERFRDEQYRLPQGAYDTPPDPITGQWNSTLALSNGNAQVYVEPGTNTFALIYPQINFTSGYMPSQSGRDYSGFTGDQLYLRAFKDAVNPHNSGKLKISGLVLGDFESPGYTNAKVEIKLPSQTGWLDLGKPYDPGDPTPQQDGDGCRTSASGDEFGWSSGGKSTANSGYMIIVRITLKNANKQATYLAEIGW